MGAALLFGLGFWLYVGIYHWRDVLFIVFDIEVRR